MNFLGVKGGTLQLSDFPLAAVQLNACKNIRLMDFSVFTF